jgi:hypothetical protein
LAFIEGIGPNIGFFSWWSLYQVLNCFQNQSLFYKNELIPLPCGYMSPPDAIRTISSNENYNIQINTNQIEIRFPMDENVQISLYDISGRMYYNKDFSSGKDVIISTSSFQKGIYILKIFNRSKNQTSINKIIL